MSGGKLILGGGARLRKGSSQYNSLCQKDETRNLCWKSETSEVKVI
jgi:hypothetical protein